MAKVWAIDDEAGIRNILKRGLASQGHEIETFPTADEALERIVAGEQPDAIFCDFVGEGINADEFYEAAFDHLGEKVLRYIISGTPNLVEESIPNPSKLGIRGIFEKPFNLNEIANTLASDLKLADAKTVWVIDDEDAVRELISESCKNAGYNVAEFKLADDALTFIKAGVIPDAIICDGTSKIGGMHGAEFYEKAHPYLGSCIRYLATGGLMEPLPDSEAILALRRVINKPFSMNALGRIIDSGFGKPVPTVWTVGLDAQVYDEVHSYGFETRKFDSYAEAISALESGEAPDAVVGYCSGQETVGNLYVKPSLKGVPRIIIAHVSEKDQMVAEFEDLIQKSPQLAGTKVISWNDNNFDHELKTALEEGIAAYQISKAATPAAE